MDDSVNPTKLIINGKQYCRYEIDYINHILFIKMDIKVIPGLKDEAESEDFCVVVISGIENKRFLKLSFLNIE